MTAHDGVTLLPLTLQLSQPKQQAQFTLSPSHHHYHQQKPSTRPSPWAAPTNKGEGQSHASMPPYTLSGQDGPPPTSQLCSSRPLYIQINFLNNIICQRILPLASRTPLWEIIACHLIYRMLLEAFKRLELRRY